MRYFVVHDGISQLLSLRLKAIYEQILSDKPVWDIGCDHGYVALHAYRNGICSEVHLVDRSAEALRRTRLHISRHFPERPDPALRIWHLDAECETLPIAEGTVVLAGLGIKTIVGIIANLFGGRVPQGVRLVLACAKREEWLRLQLLRLGWRLQGEELYPENGHVRQLVVCGSEGEAMQPFWNASDVSKDRGLLDEYLSELRHYYSVSRPRDADPRYLKETFVSDFGL